MKNVLEDLIPRLRVSHQRYLVVLNVVERTLGRVPFVASGIRDARRQLEEWADAAAIHSRPTSRNALVNAIVHASSGSAGAPSPRADSSSRIERLERLVFPLGRTSRAFVYLPACVLTISAAMLVMGWFTESHHAIALGSYCPD